MVHLWRLFQSSMGVGYLPDSGGTMDQPAIMLSAFSFMSSFEARMKDEDQPLLNEDGEIDHQEIGRRVAEQFGVPS